MIWRLLRSLVLGLSLWGGILAAAPGTALAEGCLSRDEMRASVQSGEALSFSRIKRQIEAATGAEVQGFPRLCGAAGQLVYQVNVIGKGGRIKRLTVDARSGNIVGSGY